MSSNRIIMKKWVLEALKSLGGKATIIEVAKEIWDKNWPTIEKTGDLRYTWQYDMRWAADILRRERKLKSTALAKRGFWELA